MVATDTQKQPNSTFKVGSKDDIHSSLLTVKQREGVSCES